MTIDKTVLSAVCRVHGHNLASLQTEMIKDPRSGGLIPQFKILCVKCGATESEIALDVRVRRSSGKRRARGSSAEEAALLSPPPPIDASPGDEI